MRRDPSSRPWPPSSPLRAGQHESVNGTCAQPELSARDREGATEVTRMNARTDWQITRFANEISQPLFGIRVKLALDSGAVPENETGCQSAR